MYRPIAAKIYEPNNPEYSLVDAMTSELFELFSPEIKWWNLNITTTQSNLDSLDQLYGEEGDNKLAFNGPFNVYGRVETNPILKELSRLGHLEIREIDFYVNIAAMNNYLENSIPREGDIFRLTYLGNDPKIDRKFFFYVVNNIIEVDLYNCRYINYQIAAEQTTLNNVPDIIKNYSESD